MSRLEPLDRAQIRAWIEEATGAALPVHDPLPDSLVACAQAVGLSAPELRLFVFDEPERFEAGSWYRGGCSTLTAQLTNWRAKRASYADEEEAHA